MRFKSLILLVIILITGLSPWLLGCHKQSDQTAELAEAFIQYSQELTWAEDMTIQQLNDNNSLLENGEISTYEFRQRVYYTQLRHAYIVEYIDSKPEYRILFPYIYGQEDPPQLMKTIPQLESDPESAQRRHEIYLEDWITAHYVGVDYLIEQAIKGK